MFWKPSLLSLGPSCSQLIANSIRCSSGRWFPQPARRCFSANPSPPGGSDLATTQESASQSTASSSHSLSIEVSEVPKYQGPAVPPYYTPRVKTGKDKYRFIKGAKGEDLADYVLFEDAIHWCEVPWKAYGWLPPAEKRILTAHMRAVEARQLTYICPDTKKTVFTVAQHLYRGDCCGNGCRHCPFEQKNCRYELSKHRTRPPTVGIHRRTRMHVVDNSALGKEAHTVGKLAYCIHVYKQGYRAKHMPKAVLGDKILVAIRGQMKKGFVVGAKTHVHYRKHGVPSTDRNNIVLLDDDGNPLGNRIQAPIPLKLLEKKDRPQFAKVLALANKFF